MPPPVISAQPAAPALATAVGRVVVRGRPTTASEIEELSRASVSVDGERVPSDPGRGRPAQQMEGDRGGRLTSGMPVRVSFGFQANESSSTTAEASTPRAQRVGAYENAMRTVGSGGRATGTRHDHFY